MRILMAAILFIIPTILHAADLCDAGYYLTDTGECDACPQQYYCPGDNIRYECPDAELHKRTTFPDYYYNPVIYETGITATPIKKILQECYVLSWMQSERGELYEYAGYNTDTGKYDRSGTYNWLAVNPGYYLTTPTGCTGWTYYHDAIECPAGAYCPGKDKVYCDATNEATVHTPTFGLETCPAGTYSEAGATECTKCPSTTYSDTPGAAACTPCPDPKTHLRTWFPDYYYENPVIMSFEGINNQNRTRISSCAVLARISTDRGEVNDSTNYNPETEQYDRTYNSSWRSVKPGYYLTTPSSCGALAYYKDLVECPAGSYCPGKDFVTCNAENKAEVHTPTFGLETCPAGTYSAAGATECTQCPTGTYSADGAATCTECPDPKTHKRTTFPDYYYENVYIRHTYQIGGRGNISSCTAIVALQSDRGKVYDYARYNPDTEKYDNTYDHLWYSVNPGYYLTTRGTCGAYAYYRDALECPAGAYCPGKEEIICTPDNRDVVQTQTFGLETCSDNSYSDIGAAACTPCVHGTGNFGDLASDHATASSCLGLCAAGYTKLNIGTRKFNLWPTDKCTSPSLRASVNDSVCCVHLAPGHGPGINVELHNKVYHTTN